MKKILSLVIVLIVSLSCQAQHMLSGTAVSGESLSAPQWKQDIDYLQKEILRTHPDPFYKNQDLDSAKFNRLFAALRSNAGVWDADKMVTEITRIVGLLNNGHSSVNQFENSGSFYDFRYFPLFLYYFPEGLYVMGATNENKAIIGQKLVAIDNVAIEEITKMMRQLTSKDYGNEYSFKDGVRYLVIMSQYLHGLGIIKNQAEAVYTFADSGGKKTSVKLSSGPLKNLFTAFENSEVENRPLYRQNARKNYWFKYLNEHKTLYIKYTVEQIDKNLLPADFCKQMQDIIDTADVKKVIVDLRQSQGGNIGTLKPFYEFLLQAKINRRGKLVVLIDRRTQSAATVLAVRLSMISKAVFVGEPTVSAVNLFDNPKKFSLPNSKISINIVTHFERAGFPVDNRIAFNADIPMEITANDYFSLKDPVMDFALAYTPPSGKLHQSNEIADINDINIEGAYEYGPLEELQIRKQESGWNMKIADGRNIDFLNTPMYPLSKKSFATDIKNLTVTAQKDGITLKTLWGEMTLKKIPSGYQTVQELVSAGKTDEAVAAIKTVFGTLPKVDHRDFESKINSFGYQLLNAKDVAGATELLKLNTQLFPGSYNAWDSLGECYAAAGKKDSAIRCYEKALDIEPGYISSMQGLQKLRQ